MRKNYKKSFTPFSFDLKVKINKTFEYSLI